MWEIQFCFDSRNNVANPVSELVLKQFSSFVWRQWWAGHCPASLWSSKSNTLCPCSPWRTTLPSPGASCGSGNQRSPEDPFLPSGSAGRRFSCTCHYLSFRGLRDFLCIAMGPYCANQLHIGCKFSSILSNILWSGQVTECAWPNVPVTHCLAPALHPSPADGAPSVSCSIHDMLLGTGISYCLWTPAHPSQFQGNSVVSAYCLLLSLLFVQIPYFLPSFSDSPFRSPCSSYLVGRQLPTC